MDKEWENILVGLAVIGAVVFFVPRVLPDLVAQASAFLLSWAVVVPSAQAVVRIPATDIGLDAGRLVIAAGLLLGALVFTVRWGRSRREDQA